MLLAAVTVFFPVFLDTAAGVREVDPGLIDAVRLMGGSRRAVAWKAVLPASMSGLRTGLLVASSATRACRWESAPVGYRREVRCRPAVRQHRHRRRRDDRRAEPVPDHQEGPGDRDPDERVLHRRHRRARQRNRGVAELPARSAGSGRREGHHDGQPRLRRVRGARCAQDRPGRRAVVLPAGRAAGGRQRQIQGTRHGAGPAAEVPDDNEHRGRGGTGAGAAGRNPGRSGPEPGRLRQVRGVPHPARQNRTAAPGDRHRADGDRAAGAPIGGYPSRPASRRSRSASGLCSGAV
ncbi:ABC transporter permease [Cryptosporangium sp. NPDC051539]|uniref:ABC transporter permease n=1 Tax=Cryptosporangium sp. NPDC051539 TaxID=3363962 RepID=UPI003788A79B